MAKINWENEKENLEKLIQKRVPYTCIAELYGIKNASHIKKMAIKLGIKILDYKSGEYYKYEKPIFKCKYCGKEFNDRYQLTGHITHCKSNPKYQENMALLAKAREHIKKRDETQIYYCSYCGKEVHNKGSLKNHEKACPQNPNAVKCPNRKGNGGHSKGHYAWNRGKTIADDERILKQVISRRQSIKCGKVIISGTPHTEDTKRLLREKMINYIKENGNGEFGQHFSIKGCKFIDELNKKYGWNLIHAQNGGEKQVCGYFLDGYDEHLNIAFEYDEPKHYKDVYNNILCDRDVERQKNIINELNCTFYRYNEKMNKLYMVGGQDG